MGEQSEIEVGSRWRHHSMTGVYRVQAREMEPFNEKLTVIREQEGGTSFVLWGDYFRENFCRV